MQIGETRGNIDGHAEEQRSRANRKSDPRHRRRTKAPGRTGVRTVGGARDQRRFGVTRRFSLTKPEGERTGATREVHQLVPEDAVPGRPGHWSSAIPKHRCTGQPGNGLSAPPKHSILGSPRGLIAGKSRKVRDAGKPEACITGTANRAEYRGNLELRRPAMPKDARFESPRKSIAGHGPRIALRGNSKRRSPTQPTDAATGKPENALQAESEEAGTGATRLPASRG
jgi:hypothetical protein